VYCLGWWTLAVHKMHTHALWCGALLVAGMVCSKPDSSSWLARERLCVCVSAVSGQAAVVPLWHCRHCLAVAVLHWPRPWAIHSTRCWEVFSSYDGGLQISRTQASRPRCASRCSSCHLYPLCCGQRRSGVDQFEACSCRPRLTPGQCSCGCQWQSSGTLCAAIASGVTAAKATAGLLMMDPAPCCEADRPTVCWSPTVRA
jgi:hypothetical protein